MTKNFQIKNKIVEVKIYACIKNINPSLYNVHIGEIYVGPITTCNEGYYHIEGMSGCIENIEEAARLLIYNVVSVSFIRDDKNENQTC